MYERNLTYFEVITKDVVKLARLARGGLNQLFAEVHLTPSMSLRLAPSPLLASRDLLEDFFHQRVQFFH